MPQINQLPPVITPASSDQLVVQQADGITRAATPSGLAKAQGLGGAAYLNAGGPNGVAVLDPSGNASALPVIATGATTARTLAARLSDVISVEDFGVVNDPSGAKVAANTAAYQAALNAAAGVARLRHRAGLTVYHTGLTITQPYTVLEIDGNLTLAPTVAGETVLSCIYINANNIAIYIGAAGVVDGNQANQQGVSDAALGNSCGITTYQSYTNAPNPSLENIFICGPGAVQNTLNNPISVYAAKNVTITNLRVIGGNNAFQVAQGTTQFEISNCYVLNNPDYGFAAYQGCSYGHVHNNVFDTCGPVGTLNDGTASTGYNQYPNHHVVFSHNTILNSIYQSLSIISTSYAGVAAYAYDIVFSDNQIVKWGTASNNNVFAAIYLGNCFNVSVLNNRVSGGGTTGSNNFGILGNSASYTNISGNIVENMGQLNEGIGFGIDVNGFSYSVFENNWIRDTQTTHTMAYGFSGAFGANCVAKNNRVDNMTAAAFDVVLASDTIYENPQAITVASLPAQGGYIGNRRIVYDALTPAYNTTLAGGSTSTTIALWNGTGWVAA